MKLTKLTAFAALGMLMSGVVSCSNEVPAPATSDGNVTFTARLANVPKTRAFATGEQATNLTVLICDQDGKFLLSKTATFENLEANVQLNLLTGDTYQLIFFANGENSPYTISEQDKTVTIDYSKMNPEGDNEYVDSDCFYKVTEYTAGSNESTSITLTRPVAQVNFGTDDLEKDLTIANFPQGVYTQITFNAYTQMDLLTGSTIGDPVKVAYPVMLSSTLDNETYPSNSQTADGKPLYKYLSMNYALVEEEGGIEDILFQAIDAESAGKTVVEFTVPNAPLKRNYRTNIYGTLLSPTTIWNIEIDANWDGDMDVKDYEDAIAQGGNIVVNIPLDELTIPENLDAPANIELKEKVGKLNVGPANQPVTISVAKDVEYPEIVFEQGADIKDLTIKGDPESSQILSGFDFYNNKSLSRPASLENLTLDGVTFEGTGFEPEYAVSTKNTVIRNCKFTKMTRSAVMTHVLDGSTDNLHIDGMTIENCTFDYADGLEKNMNGLYIQDVEGDIVIRNCTIKNSKYHGIQVTPRRVNKGGSVVNVLIEGCTIEGNAEDGIKVQEMQGGGTVTIRNNTFSGNVANAIRLKNAVTTYDITITDNKIDMAGVKAWDGKEEPCAILLKNSTANAGAKVIVKDNTITNSNGHDYLAPNVVYADGSEYPEQAAQ